MWWVRGEIGVWSRSMWCVRCLVVGGKIGFFWGLFLRFFLFLFLFSITFICVQKVKATAPKKIGSDWKRWRIKIYTGIRGQVFLKHLFRHTGTTSWAVGAFRWPLAPPRDFTDIYVVVFLYCCCVSVCGCVDNQQIREQYCALELVLLVVRDPFCCGSKK